MKQDIHRLEIIVPEGKNPFLEVADFPGHDDNHKDWKAYLRIAGGRSFLSGFDMVLFDGIILLEVKLTVANYKIKPKPEMIIAFIQKLAALFPDKYINWDSHRQVVELSLLEACDVSIDQSSVGILQKLAQEFQVSVQALLDQNSWQLVRY